MMTSALYVWFKCETVENLFFFFASLHIKFGLAAAIDLALSMWDMLFIYIILSNIWIWQKQRGASKWWKALWICLVLHLWNFRIGIDLIRPNWNFDRYNSTCDVSGWTMYLLTRNNMDHYYWSLGNALINSVHSSKKYIVNLQIKVVKKRPNEPNPTQINCALK